MGRGDDDAAPRQMSVHDLAQPLLGRHVKRAGRLVEQPDRPRHRQHAGKRQPPPLPGREITGRQAGEIGETDRGKATFGAPGIVTVTGLPLRKRAQNIRFSATVKAGLSGSTWPT